MQIIKNAAGKWLIETDEDGLCVIQFALEKLECSEDCPVFPNANCMAQPACEYEAIRIGEALNAGQKGTQSEN